MYKLYIHEKECTCDTIYTLANTITKYLEKGYDINDFHIEENEEGKNGKRFKDCNQ